ncbi:cytochrome P450 89A2-like [Aegilops tauschii subsp. strangulata]|uniref:Cytochrome P450 89A2 n=1 Tax=Aegilops tauschii subsp. strangulata TaxID=200361 RepID=A0A452ZW29_AEGTS
MATLHIFFLIATTILFALLLLLRFRRVQGDGRRLPPGPPSLLLLFIAAWLGLTSSPAEAEPLLQRLVRRYGPIVSLRVGSRLAIFVADRRLAHTVLVQRGAALADRPSFASARILGADDNYSVTRAGYGPVWRLLRRNLVAGTLHPSRGRRFTHARFWARHVLVDKLRRLADDGEAPAPVTPTFQYAVFYLLLIMCFGERLDEKVVRAIAAAQHEQVRYMFSKMSVFAFLPSVAEHLFRGRVRKMLSLRRRQKELFLPLINARREYKDKKRGGEREPRRSKSETTLEHSYVDTLFDVRLPEEGNRPLTDDEMVNLCSEFLTAGADTTSTALHWIMAELVKNQAIQERLYKEIKAKTKDGHEEVSEEDIQSMPYLKAVVLEGLRKHPPVHFVLPHMAAEDVEVGGYLVPKGATVNFMVAEMGRDEREWEKPMEFIPERFSGGRGVDVTGGSTGIRMMPFGVGRRICAGLNIAVLHLLYFVANMVREFEWKEAAGHEIDLAEKLEFMVVMKKQLRPRLVPRKPNMQTEEHM